MEPTLFAKGNQRTVGKLERLRKDAHAERAPRVALRIQGILLSLEQHNVTEIANLLHVHRDTVRCWVLAWNAHREIGLLEGHRSGRPAKLTDKEKETLYDIVESGPVAYGFETGVWTSPIISRVIQEEFGVVYHPGHVRKLLKDFGFSIQRPGAKLARADLKQQNRWIRYTRPNLKKMRGFTLIELLIVVAIIAILAAIAVPNFLEAQVRAKVSRAHADMRSVGTAIESYMVDHNRPPPGMLDMNRLNGLGGDWKTALEMAVVRLSTPVAYIASYPNDEFVQKEDSSKRTQYLYIAFSSDPTESASEKKCYAMGYLWALHSKGPSQSNADQGGIHGQLGNRTGFVYDATNGSKSAGSIWRTNKGVSDANGN